MRIMRTHLQCNLQCISVADFLRGRQDGVQSAQPVLQARSHRLSQVVSIDSFKKRLQ